MLYGPAGRVVLVLLLVVAAGCGRSDPQRELVAANSAGAYSRWRSAMQNRLTADQWREFDAMMQEIRLRVTFEREATGSEAVEAATRRRIDGWTLREVIVMGHQMRLIRLYPDIEELKEVLMLNTNRVGNRNPASRAAELTQTLSRQNKRLAELDEEFDASRARLAELGRPVLIPKPR